MSLPGVRCFLITTLLFIFSMNGEVWAQQSSYPGYLESVSEERSRLSTEIVIMPLVESTGPTLHDQIFSEKLSRDFRDRYERDFGRTQGEQIQQIPSRFFDKDLGNGQFITNEEYTRRQEKFGNYMSKRLVEFHADKYMKDTPSGQRLYKFKEKVSNVTVETKKGFSYKFRYNLASNDLTLKVDNPYDVDSRVILEGSNVRLSLSYWTSKTVQLLSDFHSQDNLLVLSGVKRLKRNWGTSLTASSSDIEDKFIVGLSWAD